MNLNKSRTQKTLISLGGKTLAVAAVAVIASLYFASRIRAISTSLVQEKKLALMLEMRARGAETLYKDRTLIAEAKGHLERALFSTDEILEFLGALETLAGTSTLTTSIRFSDPVQTRNPSVVMIPYTVTLNGNIFTLLQYLKNFERLPYFTRITSFTIRSPETGFATDSSITFTASVYARTE